MYLNLIEGLTSFVVVRLCIAWAHQLMCPFHRGRRDVSSRFLPGLS